MAYGYYCPVCHGTVDNNEFNFGKGICCECEEIQAQKEILKIEIARLLNSDAEQIIMELSV